MPEPSAPYSQLLMSACAGPNGSSPGGLRTIPELIALAVNVAHSNGVSEVGMLAAVSGYAGLQ